MAKFCYNCGTPYEEGAVFCANCGTNLSGAPVPKVKKSAISVASLREVANKRAKAMMIIVLVVSLLIGLATISGSYDITITRVSDGKIVGVSESVAKECYAKTGSDALDGACTSMLVLNVVYGVALLGVAILTILAMLENACGGKGEKLFKLASVIAVGATALFALLFLVLCRRTVDSSTFILEVPVSAWFNLALFGSIAVLNLLPEKKEA